MESEEKEKQKKRIQNTSKNLRNIVDKVDRSKTIRFGIWAVFLIIVGLIAAFNLPEHSTDSFFDLLKAIITSLVV